MENLEIDKDDLELITAIGQSIQTMLVPVPFFILSPSSLTRKNEIIVDKFLTFLVQDECFRDAVKTQNGKVVKFIALVARYEVWKRGITMRVQWLLQLVVVLFVIYWVFS